MSEVEKWDRLINVCYKGGYAGDFFCNLLYSNYNEEHNFVGDKDNRYEFNISNYSLHEPSIKNINFLIEAKTNYNIPFFNNSIFKNHYYFNRLAKIYNICYDENYDIYIKNLISYIKDVFYLEYTKGKINISPLHLYRNTEKFDLNDIFPKSTNILLMTDSMLYTQYFIIFSWIKNLNRDSIEFKKIYMKRFTEKNFIVSSVSNMHSIDIGKLIFEPDSIGQIENQLSDILQKKIILNRQKLEHYRQTSLKQIQELKKYGIEITEDIEFSFYEKQLLEI